MFINCMFACQCEILMLRSVSQHHLPLFIKLLHLTITPAAYIQDFLFVFCLKDVSCYMCVCEYNMLLLHTQGFCVVPVQLGQL